MPFNYTLLSSINSKQEAKKVIDVITKAVFILTALLVLMMYTNGWYHSIDAIIYVICGYCLLHWRSRGAALVLLLLSLIRAAGIVAKVFSFHHAEPNTIIMALAMLYIGIRAVDATFKLHGVFALEPEITEDQPEEDSPVCAESASQVSEPADGEEAAQKEWYILFGIKGRAFSQEQIKGFYDAGKVKIRGPYLLENVLNYHDKGMITNDTVLHRKGDNEWKPFDRYALKPAVSVMEEPAVEEPVAEWFVLIGVKDKVLDSEYVKGLYDAEKVRIKGPFSTEALVAYHQNGTIDNQTIVNKKGDRDWMPVSKQKIGQIDEAITSAIFEASPATPSKSGFSRFATELYYYLCGHKKAVAATFVMLCLFFAGYEFYIQSPEQIYSRIKRSVVLISMETDKGQTTGLGTGFILDDSDIIATNFHVIDGATSLSVKSGDNRLLDIDGVVYVDPKNDLALLKIKNYSGDLSGIPRGSVNDIKIGEKVYTIGNPAGLEFSLSEGIVSGKRDTDPIDEKHRELIQITAPISPGNSGGPLLDKRGHVIGVTSMASKNDFQNLNFATPIKLIEKTSKYKEIIFKFLPQQPKWKHIGTTNDKTPDFDHYQRGESNRIIDGYYNPDSVASFGDQRKRFWAKLNIKQNYSASFQVTTNVEMDGFLLMELDCKNNRYKFNTGVAQSEGKNMSYKSDFSDEGKWQGMNEEDKQLFAQICKPI